MPTSTPTNATQLRLPLQEYVTSVEEEALVQRAAAKAAVACAEKYGVQAVPAPVDLAAIHATRDLSRRYGLVDLAEAQQHGYVLPPTEEQRPVDSPSQALADEALSGMDAQGNTSALKDAQGNPLPEGGCSAEGWRRVRGDVSHDYDLLPTQLLDEAWSLTIADEDFQQAEADWAACMAKRGHDFKHSYEAGNSVAGSDPETQRQMAIMDAECALQVNLPGRAMAVDAGYQQMLIDQNEAQLRAVLEQKRTLLSNAKEALG